MMQRIQKSIYMYDGAEYDGAAAPCWYRSIAESVIWWFVVIVKKLTYDTVVICDV